MNSIDQVIENFSYFLVNKGSLFLLCILLPIMCLWRVAILYILFLCVLLVLNLYSFFKFTYLTPISLRGKICVITGASDGLGLQFAKVFSGLGMVVINLDIIEPSKENNNTIFIKCDLTQFDEYESLVDSIVRKYGHPYLLINNAGYFRGSSLEQNTDEKIIKTINTNLLAPLLLTKHLLKSLASTKGHIIMISSILGLVGVQKTVDYCASKYGIIGVYDSLVSEIRTNYKNEIKIGLVCPGHIKTKMFKNMEFHHPFLTPTVNPQKIAEKVARNVVFGISGETYIPVYANIGKAYRIMPSWLKKAAHYVIDTEYSTKGFE